MASTIAEDKLFAPATPILRSLALISLLALAAMLIIGVARRLTEPLDRLAHQAREIAAGHLGVDALAMETGDAAGQLAAKFGHLATELARRPVVPRASSWPA